MSVLDRLEAQRLVPVLRCSDAQDALVTARAAVRAGFGVIELTLTTPGVHDAIRALVAEGVTVALGTVTERAQVAAAAAAGAEAVVSFASPPGFLAAAADAGLAAIPGALTPAEILAAAAGGASVVKLFPARLAGPGMLADMRAVLPGVRLLPTGGVATDDARRWLDAGAIAVGLGASLGTAARDGEDEVERRCRAALAAVDAPPAP